MSGRLDSVFAAAGVGDQARRYGAVAVAVLSVLYYALYFDAGFNYADDGVYAQTAYELFLGRDPHTLAIAYGLTWFQIGNALFTLFGPNYLIVKGLFFGLMVATNVLVFRVVARHTGSAAFALAATAIPALVPAYPATSFYGFCVLINVAAQMRLARRLSASTIHDGALAGLALSVSFLIRPDFGYIFTAPLALVLMICARHENPSGSQAELAQVRKLLFAVLVGFAAGQLPAVVIAGSNGALDLLVGQYFAYPKLLAYYACAGLGSEVSSLLGCSGGAVSGNLLQRPGLELIGQLFTGGGAVAFLVYAPIFCLGGAAVVGALRAGLWRQRPRMETTAIWIVLVAAGVATLPHYLLYRPDLAHVANYMPGYTVFAAAIFWWLLHAARPHRPLAARIAATTVAGLISFQMGVYLVVGLPSVDTGAIGLARGRDDVFRADNGVVVRVNANEKIYFDFIRQTITDHSKPGDAIVCLPFCPGFAFMTGRRMLLENFYADDSFPASNPGWLPRTIALTEQRRPPIVLLLNDAINGTEQSRISAWGAPYIRALDDMADEKIEKFGLTFYVIR